MQEDVLAALVAPLVAAVACLFGPRLIALLPEPQPDPDADPKPKPAAESELELESGTETGPDQGASVETGDRTASPGSEASAPADDPLVADVSPAQPPAEAVKPLYVDLAARPHLASKLALAGGVAGAVVGAQIGWQPVLGAWVYLAVIGVVLGYIDAQTRLLPTRIIAPSYGFLLVALLVAGLVDDDRQALTRSGLGWLAMGGFYFVMWFIYPKGLGYGDVRLSGLLGLALGYLGWPEVLVGMYAGFLLGGVGGGLLSLVKVFDRKRYPFGPFMLLGALVGLIWGDAFGSWYLLN